MNESVLIFVLRFLPPPIKLKSVVYNSKYAALEI